MVSANLILHVGLVALVCVVQVTRGGLNGKLISMLKKKADLCTKTKSVSLSQMEQMDMVAQKCPKSETGMKAMGCITQQVGLIDDNCQINMDGVKEMSKKYGRNKGEKEKIIKAGETCKATVSKKVKECGEKMESMETICKCMMTQKMF